METVGHPPLGASRKLDVVELVLDNEHPAKKKKDADQETKSAIFKGKISCNFNGSEAPSFVLKLSMMVNGQPMDLKFSDGHLELNYDESLSSKTVALSMDAVARDVQKCLRSCGCGIVCKEIDRCEDATLFQVLVTVPSFEEMFLKKLIDQLPQFGVQMQLALQETLALKDVSCVVKAKVYFVRHDTARVLVTIDNVDHYLDLWKKGRTFDFDHVMLNGDTPSNIVQADIEMEMTLQQLQEELKDVVMWFSFGVGLGIEESELLKIENDHRNQTERCLVQVLIVWMRRKHGSWSDVVNALRRIRMEKEAKRIAKKYRVTGYVAVNVELGNLVTVDESLIAAESAVYYNREDALTLLREKKELEKERDTLKKRAEDLERELDELKSKEKRDEDTIARKEEDLRQARKALQEAEEKIKKHKAHEEAAKKKLQETDRKLHEKKRTIRKMEKKIKKKMEADLAYHKTFVTSFIGRYSSPDSSVSAEHGRRAESETEKEKVEALTQRLEEHDKSIACLKQQIIQLQSQTDLDLESQMQLSQLQEKVSKEEKESDKVDAQLATSSKVAQAIEETQTELKALCDRLPTKPSTSVSTQTELREVPVILRLRVLDSKDDD